MNRIERLHDPHLSASAYVEIGFDEFIKNIKSFAIFIVIFGLPPLLVALFLPPIPQKLEDFSSIPAEVWPIMAIYIVATSLLSMLGALAVPAVVERSILGRAINLKDIVIATAPKLGWAIVVGFITGLAIFAGGVALLVPGIYLAVQLAFITQSISLRNCGFNAMAYSWSLVKGQWWKVFGRFLLIGLLALGLAIGLAIASIPIGFLALVLPFIGPILSGLLGGLVGYALNTIITVMFLHLDYVRNPILHDRATTA